MIDTGKRLLPHPAMEFLSEFCLSEAAESDLSKTITIAEAYFINALGDKTRAPVRVAQIAQLDKTSNILKRNALQISAWSDEDQNALMEKVGEYLGLERSVPMTDLLLATATAMDD